MMDRPRRPEPPSSQPHPDKATKIQGYTVDIVAARAGVSIRRVRYLEREGLVAPLASASTRPLYGEDTIERIRIIERLMGDLGVNLPGAEVILHMREQMLVMLDELHRVHRHESDRFGA